VLPSFLRDPDRGGIRHPEATADATAQVVSNFVIRHSCFFRHLAFVIRRFLCRILLCHPRRIWHYLHVKAFTVALVLLASSCLGHCSPRVLVYQKNGKGFVHDNLAASAAAIRELGVENNFAVEVSTNPAVFTDDNLKQYRALIFANSNNEAFDNEDQRGACQRFIRGGGGFMGIHSSSGSERQWPWFQQMLGAKFLRHPPLQKFTMNVLDPKFPATAHLGKAWQWEDECYLFTNLNPDIKVLLALDPSTLKDPKMTTAPGEEINGLIPLAWYHEFEGARVFYTALGHKIAYYSDPVFRKHLLGGILWVLNEKPKANP
jgi:type 1 glutamine amidotransferase